MGEESNIAICWKNRTWASQRIFYIW